MSNKEKKIWGIHIQDDNLFLKENWIAIGWHEMGDLSKIDTNRDAFKEKYTAIYPDAKSGVLHQVFTHAGLWRDKWYFRRECMVFSEFAGQGKL